MEWPEETPEDAQLFLDFRAGDPVAFDRIQRRFQPGLLGFIKRRVASGWEDLSQQTFLALFRQRTRIRTVHGLPGVRAWLRRVASRMIIRHRQQRRPVSLEASDKIPCSRPLPNIDDIDLIREAIKSLSPIQQEIMRLRLTETPEPTLKTIAERLNKNHKSVRGHWTRALAALRDHLS